VDRLQAGAIDEGESMSNYEPMSAPPPEGQGQGGAQSGSAPPSIRTAVSLVWAIVAVSIVSLVLTFVYIDDIVAAAGEDLSQEQRDLTRTASLVGAVFFGVVINAVWVVMGIFLRKGRNWARIVLTILAGIGVLGGLFGFAGDRPALLTVVGVITLALEAALLFFLWKKESSAFLQPGRR
jgi:O-antigen/teichoic acid export membrane protein